MQAYLASILAANDSPALRVGGVMDHVHALCDLSRSRALSDVIKEAKRASSLWVKKSLGQFHWQAGHGAFSVSQSNVARVKAYIAGQEEHHREKSFQDELRSLLRKHGIEYDERYLWD